MSKWDAAKARWGKVRWALGEVVALAKANPVPSAFVAGLVVAGTLALLL